MEVQMGSRGDEKALRLMSYVNCPPRTPMLQGDRRVRKGIEQLRS